MLLRSCAPGAPLSGDVKPLAKWQGQVCVQGSPGEWEKMGRMSPRLCRATVDHSHLLSLYQETLLVFKCLRRNDRGRRRCPSFTIHQVWCLAGVGGRGLRRECLRQLVTCYHYTWRQYQFVFRNCYKALPSLLHDLFEKYTLL